MSTFTASFTYTHSVTHVTTKMLLTLKEIIREIGLDPGHFSDNWASYERAISAWLTSRHLTRVTLEIYYPSTNGLVTRWDIDVLYATVGDGVLWVDTSAIKYHIAKAGLVPAWCYYDLILTAKPGRPEVQGWGPGDLRSTEGLKRYSVGATLGGDGLSAQSAYWRR